MQYWITKLNNSFDIYSQTTQSEMKVSFTACYNIAKWREETKERRSLQSVSRFLSEIVACTNPKLILTSLKFFWMSRIDNCSSAIKIPQKPSNHLPSGKWRTEFPSLIAKSTSPGLSDTIFFAHCYFTEAISEMEEIAVLGKFSQ